MRKTERGLRMMFGQRAVRRHDHRAADRDHVGRRHAVAAVARVQHARELPGRVVAHDRPHLVAEASQRFGLELGVLDDAAPEGPRVRDDDADLHRDHYRRARCASAPRTTARSSGWPCRRSARWPRSRSTCSSTRRSSAISGRPQLAALGLAGTVLAGAFTIFNFLTYGTTAVVARAVGRGPARARGAARGAGALGLARDRRRARRRAARRLAGAAAARARRARALGRVSRSTYFRIGALGLPAALVALAGQGYLRGVSNLRRPLVIVVAANVVNVVLELLFVYGFHWGIAGSAAGTAIAQAGMGVAFVVELLRPHAGVEAAEPARDAADAARRAADLRAHDGAATRRSSSRRRCARAWATRSSARTRSRSQLFFFLALVLDAVAIAGQVIVGRMLGARRRGRRVRVGAADDRVVGRRRRGVRARAAAARRTSCRARSRATTRCCTQAALLWPFFALMQPLGGAVFALDGILIGASDTRYLMWSMLAASAVFIALAVARARARLGHRRRVGRRSTC